MGGKRKLKFTKNMELMIKICKRLEDFTLEELIIRCDKYKRRLGTPEKDLYDKDI